MRVLILGGTAEASALARLLAGEAWVSPILSLAGRTQAPLLPPIAHRIGGFGGAEGLATYLRAERIAAMVDATHPFALQISANAARAAGACGIRRLVLQRPGWRPQPGDDWQEVADAAAAARALGQAPRRVFLTIGRQDLAPFRDGAVAHRYLIRSVDPPAPGLLPPGAVILTGRGPFDAAAEQALMEAERIQVVVTKNSGGADGKLVAARRLGLPVLLIARQPPPPGERVETPEAALAWLAAYA
ncbi:precorrin-6A reductase [Acidisoma sp. C75]